MDENIVIPEDITNLDKILKFAYDLDEREDTIPLNPYNLRDSFGIPHISFYNLIENLVGAGFLRSLNNSPGGVKSNIYKITPLGRGFISAGGFKNQYERNYRENLEIKERQEFLANKEALEVRQLEINIEVGNSVKNTNVSIQNFNATTEKFYKFQRNFTYVVAAATIVSAIGAITPFFRDSERSVQPLQDTLISVQLKVKQLESTLKSQKELQDSFQAQIKNSLKTLP